MLRMAGKLSVPRADPFLRASYPICLVKPKRQSTAALQNLSERPARAKSRKVLECGCALPLSIGFEAVGTRRTLSATTHGFHFRTGHHLLSNIFANHTLLSCGSPSGGAG